MKKSVVFILGFILLFGTMQFVAAQVEDWDIVMQPDTNVMFQLSSEANAHGEVFFGVGNYPVLINYTQIFGHPYPKSNPSTCTTENVVLRLYGTSNAHAEKKGLSTAGYQDVCYGNLDCTYRTGTPATCLKNEVCVVTLSSDTNAHLAKCGVFGSYNNKICCKEKCHSFPDKNQCWQNETYNCTWTPKTNSTTGRNVTNETEGGGCCEKDYMWNPDFNRCDHTADTCTIPFTDSVVGEIRRGAYTGSKYDDNYGPLSIEKKQYCAQVTKGVNYGYWENVVVYSPPTNQP